MDQSLTHTEGSSPAETRRAEILEAAAAVFAEKGFQRATMKEIAAEAGVVPGTIYLYFEGKRDLLMAIADHLIAQPMDQTLSRGTQMDTQAFLAAILQERMRFARENKALLRALVPEIWTDPELQTRFFTQIVGPILAGSAGYLEHKIVEGRLRDCRSEIVVPAIAGTIIFFAAFRALVPGHILPGISEDEVIEELTRLFLYGLAPDAEESRG